MQPQPQPQSSPTTSASNGDSPFEATDPLNWPLPNDEAARAWLDRVSSYARVYMQGDLYRVQAPLGVSQVIARIHSMVQEIAPVLPVGTSPDEDYRFNRGRYIFALGEGGATRGIVAVRVYPGAQRPRVEVYLLQLLTQPPTTTRERLYTLRLFRYEPSLPGQIEEMRGADLGVATNDAVRIARGINFLFNELLVQESDSAAEESIRGTLPRLTNELRVIGSLNAGRALAPFLQVYQDAYLVRAYPRPDETTERGGGFFGRVTPTFTRALNVLGLVRTLAQAVRDRNEQRQSELIAQIAAFQPAFADAAFSLLEDDYGYPISQYLGESASEQEDDGNDTTDDSDLSYGADDDNEISTSARSIFDDRGQRLGTLPANNMIYNERGEAVAVVRRLPSSQSTRQSQARRPIQRFVYGSTANAEAAQHIAARGDRRTDSNSQLIYERLLRSGRRHRSTRRARTADDAQPEEHTPRRRLTRMADQSPEERAQHVARRHARGRDASDVARSMRTDVARLNE